MAKFITLLVLFLPLTSYASVPTPKEARAVMQINNQSVDIIRRGLKNALDISASAKAEGRLLDLKLVVFGPAVDMFEKGTDAQLRDYFKKLTEFGNVQFLVDGPRLQKIHSSIKRLLPGFRVVGSGAYEVLKLENDGYLYIKP